MFANSEGSGETARMRRLAWAFAGRPCDKYHNLMSWLNYLRDKNKALTSSVFILYQSRKNVLIKNEV